MPVPLARLAPPISVKPEPVSTCHCTVGAGVPLAVDVKLTLAARAASFALEYAARRDCCALGAKQMDATIAKYSPLGVVLLPRLFQKEIHAVEVDDRMTIVERIDS